MPVLLIQRRLPRTAPEAVEPNLLEDLEGTESFESFCSTHWEVLRAESQKDHREHLYLAALRRDAMEANLEAERELDAIQNEANDYLDQE